LIYSPAGFVNLPAIFSRADVKARESRSLELYAVMSIRSQLRRQLSQRRDLPRRSRCAHGFTLIEILIVVTILAIMATIVIPHFSNASVTARENMLKDELRYLRTQIIVYKAQHKDVSPGYPGGDVAQPATDTDFVNQMTKHTDDSGDVTTTADDSHKFGPYLSSIPENPLNNLRAVQIIADGDPWPTADGNTYGWFYRPSTGDIIANTPGMDANSQLYTSY
jgi:general secretion pathway protein G